MFKRWIAKLDFNTLRRKVNAWLATVWAVVLGLQFLFGGIFDLITGLGLLVLLFAAAKIDAIEQWAKAQ